MPDVTEIRPQAKQAEFLSSPADIVIYGGAAGGGKSWALLLEPLRYTANPDFGAVIFRRDRQQITNEGGLWDEACKIYPLFQPKINHSDLFFEFDSGATVGFAGIQLEKDVYKWQGSQIGLLGFDELTHFSEFQFFYMLSRNRSAANIRSYVRATTNPDADSWVAGFLEYWIDQDTGYPIPERSGDIRYLVRDNGKNHWFDTREDAREAFPELAALVGDLDFCKSVSFIFADVFDNEALIAAEPGYLASLVSLPLIDRERLLRGNWKIRPSAGKVYNRAWFEIVEAIPTGGTDVRFWDLAATEKSLKQTTKKNDPDYTATIKLRYKNNVWTIIDAYQIQTSPANVKKLVMQTAELDARESKRNQTQYRLRWEIEPGSASRRESQSWTSELAGIDARGVAPQGDKVSRARAVSAQAEAGNVKLLRAGWNEMLLGELHGFPDWPHDDIPDALSGAFNETVGGRAMSD